MKSKNFKNVTILVLILCFVFSGSNVDPEGQPLALGWFTVSKVPKIEFCFDLEISNKSTKKKKLATFHMVSPTLKPLKDFSLCFPEMTEW